MLRNVFMKGVSLVRLRPGKILNNSTSKWMKPITRQFTTEVVSNWPEEIKTFLAKENITQPTPIQEKTLNAALEQRDLVGIARTGSGKTLAFVIPAAMKVLENIKANPGAPRVPQCVVLEPTRELADQTSTVFRKFEGMGIRTKVLVGGASREAQVKDLMTNSYDVYIATPGRLSDLKEAGLADLSHVKYLVIDEADRMLDMGFEPQVRAIVSSMPEDRQTLMWSATWPIEIQQLANEFLKEFEFVAVDSETLKANPNIVQRFEFCQPFHKFSLLIDCINEVKQSHENARFLVFVNTKRRADQLLVQMMRNRLRAVATHGDKSYAQRVKALDLFKRKLCDILIATDVAARGLDINDITHVINYDMPTNIEDYIHRIGRTARYEKKGTSISFFAPDDSNLAGKLAKMLRESNQEVPQQLEAYQSSIPRSSRDHTARRPMRRGEESYGKFQSRRPSRLSLDLF